MADLSKDVNVDTAVTVIKGLETADAVAEYIAGDDRATVKQAAKKMVIALKGLDNKSFQGSGVEGNKGGETRGLTITDTLPGHRARGMKI